MTSNILIDIPQTSFEQDALGYRDFAEHVKHTIDSIDFNESVVLAVTGPWGSGKTTFVNFVIQSSKSILHIAKFNPWWFTPNNNLTELFFEKLIFELAKAYPEPNVKTLVQKFFELLRKGKRFIPSIVKGGVNCAGMYCGSPECGAVAGEITERVVEDAIASSNSEFDLDECKAQLIETLSRHNQRILFVIDDIDRLHPAEICELFNSVKIISDLPKITFLLIYERKVVENAISTEYRVDGAAYIEKIIQLQFEIPKPDDYSLHQLFYSKLTPLIPSSDLDFREWHISLSRLLLPYIKKIRDVNRIINTLTMTYPPVKNEVHFFDFLTMVFLYLFERNIYERIYENPEKFHCSHNQTNIEPDEWFIEHSLEQVEPLVRDNVRRILHEIFPVLTKKFTESDVKIWRKELRIAASESFAAYFSYSVPKHLISQKEIRDFLQIAQNGYNEAIDFIKGWLARETAFSNKINLLFEHLILLNDDAFSKEQIENISSSLLICGNLISKQLGIQSNDPFNSLTFSSAAYHFLSKLCDEDSIEKIILDAVAESESINLIMHVNHFLSPSARSSNSLKFKNPERCLRINNAIASKINELSEEKFLEIYALGNTVQILWLYESGAKAVKSKISNILASETLLIKFLELCLQTQEENLNGPIGMEFIDTDLKLFSPSRSESITLLTNALQTWKCDNEKSQIMRSKIERILDLAKKHEKVSDD